jgi:predicted DNA-binding transcriptional regulator AlpA
VTIIRTAAQILADLEASGIPEPEPEFMTTKEVADALQVSREMVRYYANTRLLPEAFRTVSGHRRFRTSDVRAIQKLTEATTAQTRRQARVRGITSQPPRAGTAVAATAGVCGDNGTGGGPVSNPGPPPAQRFPVSGGRGEGAGSV